MTETVIVAPLLLMMLMLIVQFALWEHGGHVAKAAAIEGARAVRLEGGTQDNAKSAAEDYLAQLGSKTVGSPNVVTTSDGTTASVTVHGYAEMVVPGMHLSISATSSGPVEKIR